MKKKLNYIIIPILLFATNHLIFSYAAWNINPKYWNADIRFWSTFIGFILIVAGVLIAKEINNEQDKFNKY